MRRFLGPFLAAAFLVTAHAGAQTTADPAVAQALFDDAKHLMQAGKYDEACPKLVESQRLDPGGGTLVAIALCHEAQGKTATAWSDFTLALGEARKEHRAERETLASDHVRRLEQKLVRVRVVVAKAAGVQVRRNEEVVGEAQWGTPIPIDPGTYRFEASAPGAKTWHTQVDISGEGRTIEVAIPDLERLPEAPPPPVAPPVAAPQVPPQAPPPPPPIEAPPRSTRSATFTWGLVAGGVGVVALGVGAGFGVDASSKWQDSKTQCPGRVCTSNASQATSNAAGTSADLSTAFFVAGAVGVAASAALLLWPSHDGSARARVDVSPMVGGVYGLLLRGDL